MQLPVWLKLRRRCYVAYARALSFVSSDLADVRVEGHRRVAGKATALQ